MIKRFTGFQHTTSQELHCYVWVEGLKLVCNRKGKSNTRKLSGDILKWFHAYFFGQIGRDKQNE